MRHRPSLRLVVGLAFAVLLAALSGTQAAEDEPLLLRLVRPEAEGHAEARAAWEALEVPERVALLREGLASPRRALAEVAAAEIGGPYLSLDEIHRREALLLDRFEAAVGGRQHVWGVGGLTPVGAPDVVPLWRALADRGETPRKEVLAGLHRVTLPEHLPDLVPLLERGDEHYFEALFWTVCLVANHDASDRFRTWAERGIGFGLRRLRLERGYHPEALRALSFDAESPAWGGDGLPAGFKEVARAAWGLDADGFRPAEDADADELEGLSPYRWLHRQAARFSPLESDGTFLTDVVRGQGVPLADRWWAMRHLLRFSPAWGGEVVTRIATGDDPGAVAAAAALAEAGRPEVWEALGEDDRSSSPLAWAVDPEAARARWLEAALQMVQEGVPVPNAGWALDLEPLERARYAYVWGVRIAEEDLRWIAARLAEAEVPPLFEAAYLASVLPDDLNPEVAAALAARLATQPAPEEDSNWLFQAGVEETLGALEVTSPEALRDLLVAWAARFHGADRLRVQVWLAKTGDTSQVPALLASWPDWDFEAGALGHVVHDERVAAFLKERLAHANGEEAGSALVALCVFQGIPPEVFDGFYVDAQDVEGDPIWKAAVARILAGDAVGAVLALRPGLPELGLIPDPRVESVLRRAREARAEGTYWSATAGLALQGDVAARAELLALVREGRMAFFDSLLQSPAAVVLTCDGDPEFLDAWADLVESNCCLGWAAEEVVFRERFPTMPVASTILGGFTTSAEARAWLERHRGRLRYSRILGGRIPCAAAD